MPSSEEHERELRVIEAEHAIRQRLQAECEYLRIKVRALRGDWVSFHDKLKMMQLADRYPYLAEL